MSDLGAEPGADAGINAVRLDADRTRAELSDTLGQIEQRLDPRPAIDSLVTAYRNRPVAFVSVAAGAVVGLVAVIVLAARGRG